MNNPLCFLAFFWLLFVFAIPLTNGQTVQSLVEEGDKEFASGNYQSASVYYRKAIEKNTRISGIFYKYAESLRLNREYSSAEKWYRHVINQDEQVFPLSVFWYAEMLKNEGFYDKAGRYYQRFYKNNRQNKDLQYYILKSKYEAAVCRDILHKQPLAGISGIIFADTSINSVYSEFGAFEVNDSVLYFSSSRPVNNAAGSPFKSVIYFSRKENGFWQQSLSADSILNSGNSQNGNLMIDSSDNHGYFSRYPFSNSSEKCMIYRATLVNGNWENCMALPEDINIPGYNSTQPHISYTPMGKVLFFSSDRSGGYGKYDIWYSRINPDGSFGKPVNAGSQINSMDDEITPFYYEEDTILYFSSTWHGSIGGFDIFCSKGDLTGWSVPVNLGKPINSVTDDLYYWFNPVTRNAYLSSNRGNVSEISNETCCNDIYYYRLPFSHNDTLRMQKKIAAEAKITEGYIRQAKLLVPVNLYFDNDQPDPESTDSVTYSSYDILYNGYFAKINEYKDGFAVNLSLEQKDSAIAVIDSFFINDVEKGMKKLKQFLEVLGKVLVRGQNAEITLQAYASPLNTPEYNKMLSKRRIKCLKNFLESFNDSIFSSYFKSGRLVLHQVAFGETVAGAYISDDIHDLRNSVYSPPAARERRIELLTVEFLPYR